MHGGANGCVVLAVAEGHEFLDMFLYPAEFDRVKFADVDFRMDGVIHAFFVEAEFLEEFFAGSGAREDDGNVAFGFSAQADEVFGEVEDFDGFPHVEDEDFAVSSHGTGLHDELAGFGYGHEVSDHIGVSDGEGAAGVDL